MKKFTLISSLLLVLALFSFNDYGNCPGGSSTHKAIACYACHGSSVNGVTVIGGGKTEEDTEESEENDDTFEIIVKLPVLDFESIQIASSPKEKYPTMPVVSLNSVKPQISHYNFALFDIINNKIGKKESENFTLSYSFDEAIKEPQTVIIQGVLSNNDGTVNGDYTFYKEVVMYPKNTEIESDDLEALNLSIVEEEFYFNNKIVVSNQFNNVVRIYDLQGKMLIEERFDNYGEIATDNLNEGHYFAVLSKNNQTETIQFVK